MTQYDLLLTQNTHAPGGVEFEEKYVNIGDKELLVGGDAGALNKITKITAVGRILKTTNEDGTFSWQTNDGTVEDIFQFGVDGARIQKIGANNLKIINGSNTNAAALEVSSLTSANLFLKGTESAEEGKLILSKRDTSIYPHPATQELVQIRNDEDTEYGDLAAQKMFVHLFEPEEITHQKQLTSKLYVDTKISESFAANDAMVFLGTVNAAGVIQVGYNDNIITQTITPGTTTVQDLTAYSAGWVFKFMENGTGDPLGTGAIAIEKGDMLIASKDRGASFDADDWTIIQSNIDGADIVFKSSFTKAHSILIADEIGSPDAVTAGTNTVLRRGASGSIGWAKVDFAQMNAINKNRLLGRKNDGDPTGVIEEITIGTGLSLSAGGELSATNAGTVTSVTGTAPIISSGGATPNISLQDATNDDTGVALGKIRHIPTKTFLGNKEGDTNAVTALTVAQAAGVLNGVTPPTNYNSQGIKGEIRFDANYAYFCVVGGSTGDARWKRSPVASLWSASAGT